MYLDSEGEWYFGGWRGDDWEGEGVHVLKGGEMYSGMFKNGGLNGLGKVSYGRR
jgi:hypothetical protein